MSDLSYTGADIDDISAFVLFHDRQSGVTTTHNFRAGAIQFFCRRGKYPSNTHSDSRLLLIADC